MALGAAVDYLSAIDFAAVAAHENALLEYASTRLLELEGAVLNQVVDTLKRLEHAGFHFEAADGSFELLMREAQGWKQDFFRLESYRVFVEHRDGNYMPFLDKS